MLTTLMTLAAGLVLAGSPQDTKDTKEAAATTGSAPEIFAVGKPVDLSIALADIDGKTHKLSDYKGKTVVLSFWSNNCPWSVKYEPKLVGLAKEFKDKNVVVLAIDSNEGDISAGKADGFAAIKEYNKKAAVSYPILLDVGNVVADRFKAETTPHVFVIDPKGILRYRGGVDDDPKGEKGEQATFWARDAVAAVVEGKEVANADTKSTGCSIKRVKKAAN